MRKKKRRPKRKPQGQRKQKSKRKRKKPDYRKYIKSKRWKRKREQALRHYQYMCHGCGTKKLEELQVHHRHYDTLGNECMEDLIVLCGDCHCDNHDLETSLEREYQQIMGVCV
jgi:hypothetical protein